MALSRLLGVILFMFMGFLAMPLPPASAQQTPEPEKKRDEAIQRIQKLMFDQQIETNHFAEPMPLAKFLDALERQLPGDKKILVRIDQEAFGDNYAELAATPIVLPQNTKQMNLAWVLNSARTRIKIKHDYRIDAGGYIFTTPERALYTAAYDIRDILAKPETVGWLAPFGSFRAPPWNAFQENVQRRNLDVAEKAARVVQSLVAVIDSLAVEPAPFERASIQVLNGTRLVVRTNAEKHSEVNNLLMAFRRFGDLWVTVKTQLYEVDDAFYTKLKNAKPVDWEEVERQFLEGKAPAEGTLFKLLDKQSMVLAGDEVKVDDGLVATLLSRHHAVSFLPNRDQVIQQQKSRQAILEGVAFQAGIRVSPDRRCVRVQLTEKATEVNQIKKVKVMVTNDGKEVDAEVPFMKETAHQREFEVPDGGAILIPVHYRPKALQEKNRWWVLHINPRIWIDEEEMQIHQVAMEAALPLIVADVLKNPRLKSTRDFYGTPGDKRFALIDSDAWKWSKELKVEVPGHERTPAKRAGQRLLGIRVERTEPAIAVTLVNAGGSDNGVVVGGCTIRYKARAMEKGWTVKLAESLDP